MGGLSEMSDFDVFIALERHNARLVAISERLEKLEQAQRSSGQAKCKGCQGCNTGNGSNRYDSPAAQVDNSLD